MPFVFAFAYALRPHGIPVDAAAAHRTDALVHALSAQGLVAFPQDVTWLDAIPRRFVWDCSVRTLVRAHVHEEPPALYEVDTRVSPGGVVLSVGTAHKLTRSRGVEEGPPVVHGDHVATALLADGAVVSLQLLDLRGEQPLRGPRWTALARLQNALTNLQETGNRRGIERRSFRLVPPVTQLTLVFENGSLVVRGEGHEAHIPETLSEGATDQPTDWLKPDLHEKGQVGNVLTWAVDRVRAMPWFGDKKMQGLKALAFGALDTWLRAKNQLHTDHTASEIASDLGQAATNTAKPVSFTDPDTGWPPPSVPPWLSQPIAGEGQWIVLERDPFVPTNPGAPSAFATTFLRTDRERPYTRIYITVWDPRQVDLHPVAGTVEPVSATGAAGPGLIPRTPEVMRHVVAAFNGGFQAAHGEFGMMADGVVYLPPKPYAATVATLRDGSTGFGVWPPSSDLPDNVVGYRQNLTPLVQDERWNPYGRTWWGGTPPDWTDQVHTTRSGLCLTKEGFVAYFYGDGIDAEVLGRAMIQARCSLGLHLDMNPGHTGFEFYSTAPASEWVPLGRPYQSDWEAEGEIFEMSPWRFRARRMTRHTGLMNFPRYIQRESRDFFYLTLRPMLPGTDVPPVLMPAEADEGKWRVQGLPQHGFPYALATTLIRPDRTRPTLRIRLLKIDPHTVRSTNSQDTESQTPLPLVVNFPNSTPTHAGGTALWLAQGNFAISNEPIQGAIPLLGGTLPPAISANSPAASSTEAIFGIHDEDGMLWYAEVESTDGHPTSSVLDALLQRLGCSSRLWLERPLHPLLGGSLPLVANSSDSKEATSRGTPTASIEVHLVRAHSPDAHRIFEDTPIVPIQQWQPLQRNRIRYFRHSHDALQAHEQLR